MITKERSETIANLKLALVLPVIAIVMIAFSSCRDKPGGTVTASEVIAPPPPPPPQADAERKVEINPGTPLPENAPPPPPPPPPFTVRDGDTIWSVVDVKPLYKGGDEALQEYIEKHIMYPNEAVSNKIQGTVVVSFVVEPDCSISRPDVLKGVHPYLDMEAIRVIKTLPSFQSPGYKNKRPVAVRYIMPISYKLK